MTKQYKHTRRHKHNNDTQETHMLDTTEREEVRFYIDLYTAVVSLS